MSVWLRGSSGKTLQEGMGSLRVLDFVNALVSGLVL